MILKRYNQFINESATPDFTNVPTIDEVANYIQPLVDLGCFPTHNIYNLGICNTLYSKPNLSCDRFEIWLGLVVYFVLRSNWNNSEHAEEIVSEVKHIADSIKIEHEKTVIYFYPQSGDETTLISLYLIDERVDSKLNLVNREKLLIKI